MKSRLNFVLLMALAAGTLSTGAAAQQLQVIPGAGARVQFAVSQPVPAGIHRAAWNAYRRCDPRGCYFRGRDGRWEYRRNGYYASPYPAHRYYAPRAGWYGRDGRWHAYDRDRIR